MRLLLSLSLARCVVSIGLVGLVCGTASPEGMSTMREQLRQQLDRPAGASEISRAPAPGQRLTSNPPVFVWLPVEGAKDYILQYARDRGFRDESTVTLRPGLARHRLREAVPWSGVREFEYTVPTATVRVLSAPLAPGRWYWRVGCDPGDGAGPVFGQAWDFTVPQDAVLLPFPDVKQVIAKLGRTHPRLLVTPETLPRLRELGRGELRDRLDALKRECDGYLGQELLPEPQFLPDPGSAEWAPTYTRIFRATRPFLHGMAACAEAYLLSGEERYGLEAKRRLLHVMAWDPKGSTSLSHNDEPGTELVRLGSRVYDFIYPLLAEEERERVRACLAVRTQQVYWALRVKPFEVDPFESHAMDYYMGDLTQACFAMAGEIDVEEWLEYCLTMLWSPAYPPYGGADGGWSEGPSYWGWSTPSFLRSFRLVEQATGLPIYQRDWARNTGYYKLYGNPPYARLAPFGDGQSVGGGGAYATWLLAQIFHDPYLQWAADQHGFRPSGLDAFLFFGQQVQAKPPADLPQARCFDDVGLVAMHSDLAHGERDVQVLLRSSPYGTISHSYADQNAFTLDAFGEPLAIASGYYPYYSSPHHQQWTRQTKAANSITVNDEGQPWRDWEAKGRIPHFQTDAYCHYALGDARAAYQGRLTKFDRHILYLRPQEEGADPTVVLFDDLESVHPSTFQWRLHALARMATDPSAQSVTITRNHAALDVRFLRPARLAFSQTDQFAVPPEGEADRYPNQWHLTAETTERSTEGRFLTVLLPHRLEESRPAPALELLEGEGYLGVEIRSQGWRHVIVFRTAPGAAREVAGLRLEGDVGAQSWDSAGRAAGKVTIRPGGGA